MKPSIPLLNPAFRYVPAISTDIAKRFAVERARLATEVANGASARAAYDLQALIDAEAIDRNFAARREVIDLGTERKFRAFVDVSAGKK